MEGEPKNAARYACLRREWGAVFSGMVGSILLGVSACGKLILPLPTTCGQLCLFGGWIASIVAGLITFRRWKYLKSNDAWSHPSQTIVILGSILVLLLLLVSGASILLASTYLWSEGVAEANGPLILEEPPYFLNSHGEKTEVERAPYLVKGIACELGWHCIFLALSVVAVYFGFFRCVPWPLSSLHVA